MSDLGKQIRDHYESRSLPPRKVEAIFAEGRAAAAGGADAKITPHPRASFHRSWLLALAAAFVVLAGVGSFWMSQRAGVNYAALRPVVIAFFADEPKYPMLSAEPEALRRWAVANGAPATFQIPAKLQALPGKGCTILDVAGKPVFLLCFMTVDKEGTQDGGMVHLLVARLSDFRDPPQPGGPSMSAKGDWSFASWAEGGVAYTVAAPAPSGQVRSYVYSAARGARVILHLLRDRA